MPGDPPEAPARPREARRLFVAAALCAFVVFLPSLVAGYVYDDRMLIAENYYAQSLSFIGRTFRTHLWDVHAYGSAGIGLRYYRPLVSVSYILNWLAGGGAAWAFHLVNVICHALSTLLAARVATRWTGSTKAGYVAALLFAIHPSRTESVVWISGRTDVLMALFSLLAVELAYGAAHSDARGRRGLLSGLSVLSLVAAILGKEAGALTFLLVLVDVLSEARGSVPQRRLVLLSAVFAALGLSYLGVRAVFYPVRLHSAFDPTPRYGLLTVWAYVERVVFPWPQTFFYRPMEEHHHVPVYPAGLVVLGAVTVGLYTVLLVRALRRDRAAFALLVTALALLGPLLNFTYTGIYVTTSDHFLYLPLFVAAVGVLRYFRASLSRPWPRGVVAGLAAVFVAYAAVDVVRTFDYRTEEGLYRHELDVNPENPVVLQNLSGIASLQGDLVTARALQARAVSPSAQRFFLLAGTTSSRNFSKARLLGIDAALTADGDVVALGRFENELERLLFSMHSTDDDSPLTPEGILREMRKNGNVAAVAADTALVATRIGRVQNAKRLVDALPDNMLWHVSNAANFVLTVARLGDFKRAARLVDIADEPPPGLSAAAPPEALADLSGRIARAGKLMHAALRQRSPAMETSLALAFAELGAFMQGLRVLRPVFDSPGHPPDIDPLYVQLLVSARLDEEARKTAVALLGEGPGVAAVTDMHARLGERLRAMPSPPEPSPWWPP